MNSSNEGSIEEDKLTYHKPVFSSNNANNINKESKNAIDIKDICKDIKKLSNKEYIEDKKSLISNYFEI